MWASGSRKGSGRGGSMGSGMLGLERDIVVRSGCVERHVRGRVLFISLSLSLSPSILLPLVDVVV
jgi:hypothetical protein